MKYLSQEKLQSFLHYCPETGHFSYNTKTRYHNIGDEAGYINANGYRQILVDGGLYYAHRLAFLYVTGSFPEHHVDHLNRVKTDNRWINLRDCTQAENNRNKSLRKDNKSGYTGVRWDERKQKWFGAFCHEYKSRYVGHYETAEQASKAVEAAKRALYGSQITTR
ncbi:HNH endonuclease signature motif containing protein [Burkholderia vietnamiensis]|uniref:HNH endonuclease signature motif containing protein n=1 Tax=Burkholderia vietnamiensis TaxID=60552 RepID=UPI00158ECE48|nr:HNH endonuclease signature motif containing protein [Burkholderia vietnamiensis]